MSAIRTAENKSHDLGTANKRFKDLYVGGIEAEGAVSVGSLTVGGNAVASVDNTALADVANPSETTAPSQSATKNYVDAQVSAVVDAAPETLNTLNELAAALNDDANIAATVTTNTASISTNATGISTNATAIAANVTAITSNDGDITTNATNIAANTASINSNDTDIATNVAGIAANVTDIATNSTAIANITGGADFAQIATNSTAIATNVTNIATNAAGISTNDTAISTNATGITTNAAAITTNSTNVTTNSTNVAANTAAITSNDTDIATNIASIAANAGNITSNEADIATNTGNIATNAASITDNATSATNNAAAIVSNDGDIATNVTNIATNTANITSNETDIATNTANVATNSAAIVSNDGDIATNVTNIATNAANITSNETDIATNTANVATNAANITSNETDIATNTANVATNVTNIAANATAIEAIDTSGQGTNATNIATNVTNIATNVTNITTNSNNITTNTGNITSNATDIATNTGNITTNTTNISTNATAVAARILTSNLLDDDTFGSVSSTTVASSESIKAYVDNQVSGLVDSAPAALDTLNELAAALGDDASFSTTVSTSLGEKALKATTITAGTGLTGGGSLAANRTINVADLTVSELAADSLQTSGEAFADNDTSLMTSAAIQDKILSYGYTTANSLNLNNYMPIAGGTFTSDVQVNGTFTVKGDLIQIDNGVGDPDSVSFNDANIVIDADNSGANVADGAGITLEGGTGDAVTFQWSHADSRMELKKGNSFTSLKVDSLISTSGTVEVTATAAEKLDHAVQFSVTGDVTGSASSTLEGDTVSIATTLANAVVSSSNISGSIAVTKGGTGATDAATARGNLGVDAAGTDNSTDVTLANTNYLSIAGQEITGGTIPLGSGGTGGTDAATARTNLGVDAAGTDNSTDVTLVAVNSNYLSIAGQEITAGTVPLSLGGTGATSAGAARTALGVDSAGTDNSTDVTLANTNYLSIAGQEITGGTIPLSSGGTGATSAGAARTALGVDAAGTDNSTDVTLTAVNGNYLSIDGQEITVATIPLSLGGTGATSAGAARTALGVDSAGTDNSTDVTLANTNYLSIAGQEITGGTIPLGSGGTGATTAGGARTALGVDAAGTDNSTNVTLANTNYLSITDQEITGGTIPITSGGTGAINAGAARTALGVDSAGTDNSTDVTLANTNYLSIAGQEITGGTVPLGSGGTGATTAGGARTALGVDAAGTDNSTNVTLANTNYLSIAGQTITGGTVPLTSGGTGATSAASARTALEVKALPDFVRGSAWKTTASGADSLITMSNELDSHSGSWKVINRLETTSAGGNITAVSLVADFQVRPSSRIIKLGSLPDTIWNIPSDGVLQLR